MRRKVVLDLGCGAGRWTAALARSGARTVGLDLSGRRIRQARSVAVSRRKPVHLLRGDAGRLPFRAGKFDVILSDWGAMTFADPGQTLPECARVLADGGRLVFATSHPFRFVARDLKRDRQSRRLVRPYFRSHRFDAFPSVEFAPTFSGWVELFAKSGLIVERCLEPRAPTATASSYFSVADSRWAGRWPMEIIWVVRKPPADLPRRGAG